jgi:hypothetical protein
VICTLSPSLIKKPPSGNGRGKLAVPPLLKAFAFRSLGC